MRFPQRFATHGAAVRSQSRFLFFLLPLSLLAISTSAQKPGSQQILPTDDPNLHMVINWGTQPVDSYSLYAGSAMEAQLDVLRYNRPNKTHDTTWDYCSPPLNVDNETQQQPGCAHLHMVPLSTIKPLSYPDLTNLMYTIRGLGYNGSWGLEGKFRIVSEDGIVGAGWVANSTTTEGAPAIAVLPSVLQNGGGVAGIAGS